MPGNRSGAGEIVGTFRQFEGQVSSIRYTNFREFPF
jgi:hypothetical protein